LRTCIARNSWVCFQISPTTGMDTLTAFGALAVTAMMVFYALEERAAIFVLAFVVASLAASAYGFLQGEDQLMVPLPSSAEADGVHEY